MNELLSKIKPIETIEELANVLGISSDLLIEISNNANNYYRSNKPRLKADGRKRQTYRVLKTLKDIQEQIKNNIFYYVEYPYYLQGGIKDATYPRGYIQNATVHSGNKIVIKEDIADFFPSIKFSHVFDVWKLFFRCSDDVAQILTRLTTYHGFVPQGAKTSSYLANLVLWDEEPNLVVILQSKGFTYSRLVDDITISTNMLLTKQEVENVTKNVYQMMFSKGLKPKRQKRMFMTSGFRINIHNLNTNSGRPTVSKAERKRIRAAVDECETAAKLRMSRRDYEKIFLSVRGRVAVLETLHPNLAKRYLEKLEVLTPTNIYKDVD